MFSFKKKKRGNYLSALVLAEDGTATASIRHKKGGKPVLEHCGFYPLSPGQDISANLRKVIGDQGLGKHACATLLDASDYQLMMVEAPEVPQAELKAAIRWRIRDLIDFHIDDAVLDVFDVPPSGARGVQENLYVVVSKSSLVKERIELMENAGAALEIIDIPELALRNIAARLEQDANGQAMLYFGPNQGLITLTRDATLYLARSMDIGFQQLQDTPELLDRLALELQRSLDYYDRHFQQAPIASVTLCPLPQGVPRLANQLEELIGIRVQALQLEDIVETGSTLDDEQFSRCLLAIGTALRTEPAQL